MKRKHPCETCGKMIDREQHHAGHEMDGGWSTWLCLACRKRGDAAEVRRCRTRHRDLVVRRVCLQCQAIVDNRTGRKGSPLSVGDRWIHDDCRAKRDTQLQEAAQEMKRVGRIAGRFLATGRV